MHTQSISASHIRAAKILFSNPLHNKAAFLSRHIDTERLCQGSSSFCWTSALLWILILFKLFGHEYSFLLSFAHSFTRFFHSIIYSLHSFLAYPILPQVNSLFHSQFSTKCNQIGFSFKLQHLRFSLQSFSRFLCLLHRLRIPSIFPLNYFRRPFLHKCNLSGEHSLFLLYLACSFSRWSYVIILHFYTRIILHLNYNFYR